MRTKLRYRGTLAYNGTRFDGFQIQPSSFITVQGAFEGALAAVLGAQERVPVKYAGRTDAGVHARGQVIAFDCIWEHETKALWRAINANLPHDIALRDLAVAHDPDFHPRYDALSREYIYQFYTAPVHDPIWDPTSWYVGQRIDLDRMQEAADLLIGTHDFGTFGKPTSGTVTVRSVYKAAFSEGANGMHTFDIEGNAFLQRMVRRIMGTLVQVGRGSKSIAAFEAAFRAADRRRGGPSAPARGLILQHVYYADEPDNVTGEIEQHESENLHTEN